MKYLFLIVLMMFMGCGKDEISTVRRVGAEVGATGANGQVGEPGPRGNSSQDGIDIEDNQGDNNMECPKDYGSYDIRTDDCEKCKQGYLYQTCHICRKVAACAGWNLKGRPTCCSCYEEYDKTKGYSNDR